MIPDHHYTSAFGAIVLDEIKSALRAGMPIEKIASELGDIYIAAFNEACTRRALRESINIIERTYS